MIGGTSEDDFSEAIALIRYPTSIIECLLTRYREKELLFGPQSLLARYGSLLVEVCSKPEVYKAIFQAFNSLTCSGQWPAGGCDSGSRKVYVCIMYFSNYFIVCTVTNIKAEYCDAQLPLFLAIMERSKNPIIRSNAVIALGDMVMFC
jgi:condensin complex subunit 1